MSGYILSKKKSGQYAKAYAYEIHVSKSWYKKEVAYEDVFDSYTMDMNTFKAGLNARLKELNDNEEGYTYYLSSDAKRYYQTTDAKKIAGCETATISVTCHGGTKLGEASTQYKCSSCGGSVNGHTKQCAMATSVTHESVNTSEIDSKIAETERKMASLQSEITNLEAENSELLRKIKNSNVNDAARYRQQYNCQKTRVSKPAESEKYSYPLKRNEFMLVTSPFGMRKDPLNPANTQMHKGIDIQAKHDNVLATEDKGKVTQVNNNPNTAGGLSVTVEYNRNDGSKYQCTYMHLSSIAVKTGDKVNAGQRLGVTGNTGTRTTGEHLHFGVKSISADGKARDIDPAAYLAEISQKGNIQLQTLHNGKNITAQYKVSNPASQGEVTDTAQSPEDWMKKLLSSEDSGVKMPGDDPVIEMAMTMFTSLMALALQIDNKSEEEKMQTVTDSVVSKSIDLSSLLPSYKACSVNIQDGKPYLHVDNGTVQFTRELTQAEMTKLQQTLGNANLSDDDKRRGVASIIQAATVSQQMSQNYQKGVDNQQDRQESVQIK